MQQPIGRIPSPAIEPFLIDVPESVLDDLRLRLDRSRLPNQIAGVDWEQGTELGFLTGLLDHWQHRYDWRATESRLNSFSQFFTTIHGQRFHVVVAPSTNPTAIPLVMTHGWPGSVLEFLDVLQPLSEHFHVVAPSLPGFTFSGPTSELGWHPRRIASAFVTIMDRLGHERFGVQGGDWGSVISANIADLCPDRVIGVHLNMVTATAPPGGGEITEEEYAARERSAAWRATGRGYQEIQATRPQSLGYGLEDSPVGLAAWIVEKFREWSDGDISTAFTLDRLLDNITAYWVTGTAASSLRIYWEMRQAGRAGAPARRIEVPTAIAMFPGEISYPPRSWIEAAFDVVRWSTPVKGGHFAAMEAPVEFVDDVRGFFGSLPGGR